MFINSKNMEHYAWTVALTRMISAVFRRGGDVSFVVEEMKAVFDPRGGAWMDGQYVPSLLGRDRRRHRAPHDRDRLSAAAARRERPALVEQQAIEQPTGGGTLLADRRPLAARMAQCPKCGSAALIRLEGCDQCTNCDYSKCW